MSDDAFSWTRIKRGQTEEDVESTLGTPSKVTVDEAGHTIWHYKWTVHGGSSFWEFARIKTTGTVTFDDDGTVIAVKPPARINI